MYLYVDRAVGITDLSQDLLDSLGELTSVMVFPLTAERHLARVDVVNVIEAIKDQGYYLQMPPADWVAESYVEQKPNDA